MVDVGVGKVPLGAAKPPSRRDIFSIKMICTKVAGMEE